MGADGLIAKDIYQRLMFTRTKHSPGVILALGGNALIREDEEGNLPEQYEHARTTFRPIMPLLDTYKRVLVVHGNGPQVGNELLRNEVASFSVLPLPLDTCVANSQGSMGYMIQQVLQNQIRKHGFERKVVTMITQTLVSSGDPAFSNPTKPIGIFYKENEAKRHQQLRGWVMQEDSGRGYRRVVPSPQPKSIVEMESIRTLYNSGAIVVAGGGGGIPVVCNEQGRLQGVEAVVDKDTITEIFATELKPKLLVMLTAVEQVYVNFGKANQQALTRISRQQLRKHYDNGEFTVGSMAPKIACALNYLDQVAGEVLITSPECLADALARKTGTWISHKAYLSG